MDNKEKLESKSEEKLGQYDEVSETAARNDHLNSFENMREGSHERICVEMKQVNKQYGNQVVLHDISLGIPRAQIFGLLGPSGAGKTTLIKMIAGIETASQGTVEVLGELMPKLATMKRIGYMAQSDALYGELTAFENLDFFAELYGLRGNLKKERISYVAELVNLAADLKKQVLQYSGGMKRRLSLAIALLHQPEVLILDEPTVGIDPVLRQAIWLELAQLSQQGISVIVTTHVMDEAEKCKNLAMIRDGALIAVGTPADLKQASQTDSIEAAFLYYGGAKQ